MKLKKLLEQVGDFLDADSKTQAKEIKSIRKVLKELKKKEHKLKAELKGLPKAEEEARDELQIKLDVIYAQRKKGLDRVRELKQSRKEKDD
ncbi:hypothetical protein [Marinospirillum perlucidum]|uniref:hypothetical protein n=1 Tax=Marinospirillum perlucidum TaxID=1982602 RepID=UPI000DF24176|nr:hypothetical protein [Marinospirillum perlucidum]